MGRNSRGSLLGSWLGAGSEATQTMESEKIARERNRVAELVGSIAIDRGYEHEGSLRSSSPHMFGWSLARARLHWSLPQARRDHTICLLEGSTSRGCVPKQSIRMLCGVYVHKSRYQKTLDNAQIQIRRRPCQRSLNSRSLSVQKCCPILVHSRVRSDQCEGLLILRATLVSLTSRPANPPEDLSVPRAVSQPL